MLTPVFSAAIACQIAVDASSDLCPRLELAAHFLDHKGQQPKSEAFLVLANHRSLIMGFSF